MKHRHTISFKHAFEGIGVAFRTQPNFRIHLLAATSVLAAGYFYNLSPTEWLILILTMAMVIITELINTAIEATVDLLTDQHHHYAKVAKDVAAGAVLLAAATSIIVGAFIFLPKII